MEIIDWFAFFYTRMEIHISTYGELDAASPDHLLKTQYHFQSVFSCFCKTYVFYKHVGLPGVLLFYYIDLSGCFSACTCCFGYYSFAVYFEGRYISVLFIMLRIALAVQDLLWLLANVIV